MSLIKCEKCGQMISDKVDVCPKCGVPIEKKVKCEDCGFEMPTSLKACPNCGCPNPLDGEKKSNFNFDLNFNIPTNIPEGYEKAPLNKRICAYLIDWFITFLLSLFSILCYFCIVVSSDSTTYYTITMFFAVLGAVFPITYLLIKDGMNDGRSYGKMYMGIKVIKLQDNSPCTKTISCARALITYLLDCIPYLGWIIEPVIMCVTKDGRRLADRATGTIVVNE